MIEIAMMNRPPRLQEASGDAPPEGAFGTDEKRKGGKKGSFGQLRTPMTPSQDPHVLLGLCGEGEEALGLRPVHLPYDALVGLQSAELKLKPSNGGATVG